MELIVLRASQTLAILMDLKSMENVNAMNLFLENFVMRLQLKPCQQATMGAHMDVQMRAVAY